MVHPQQLEAVARALVAGDVTAARLGANHLVAASVPTVDRRRAGVRIRAEVFDRDRYQCRYCGRRTILPAVVRLLARYLQTELPHATDWRSWQLHSAWVVYCATIAHVEPVGALGDATDPVNLVTACWQCNAAKGGLSLRALGWVLREPQDPDW